MIESLKNKIIGVDTSPFIYFFEKRDIFINFLRQFFKSCSEGNYEIVTSAITITEILVYPLIKN